MSGLGRLLGIVAGSALLGVPLMFFLVPMLPAGDSEPRGWEILPGVLLAAFAAAAVTYAIARAIVQRKGADPSEAVVASVPLGVGLGFFLGWASDFWADFCIMSCRDPGADPGFPAGMLAAFLQVGAGWLARRSALKRAASGPRPGLP